MEHVVVTRSLLNDFFCALFSHIGWSEFLNAYVIVEPVCYIERAGNKLVNCVDVASRIYSIESVGKETAAIIDAEASEFILQAVVKDQLGIEGCALVCDNPILFPYERVREFLKLMKADAETARRVAGLIHYHINEKDLSDIDMRTLEKYASEVAKLGGTTQLGLVLSHEDPSVALEVFPKGKDVFIELLFRELREQRIVLAGKTFEHGKSVDICLNIEQ